MGKSAQLDIERGTELIEQLTKPLGEGNVDRQSLARLRAATETLADPDDKELLEAIRRRRDEAHADPSILLSWEEAEARFDREVEGQR